MVIDARGNSQALVLLGQNRNQVDEAQEALLNSEEYRKREEARKRLAKYKVI